MIDTALALLRLALGLGALTLTGYTLVACLSPTPRDFSPGERVALGFGVGVLTLTLWMLVLTWWGFLYGMASILAPQLVLAGVLLLTPRGRGALAADRRSLGSGLHLGLKGWDWLPAALLAAVFIFAGLRAVLYPMWAWDAIAIWGCKAKVFYASRGLDLTCIDAHNYYPNLVPLLLTYLYFCLGQVNDHLVNMVFPVWGAMLLTLLYSLAVRLGLTRRQALWLTAFFALNGTVFIVHLYLAYADLPLAYYTLGAGGLIYLWLRGDAPRGSLGVAACFLAAMAWCKYEGPPLAATIILAAALTLLWLRPLGWRRRLGELTIPLAGLAAGYLPWRLFALRQNLEFGADHIQNFYPQQALRAVFYLLGGLGQPFYFGLLWPALLLALIYSGRRLWRSPRIFLALFLGGNLLAILLAYAVAPTGTAEFPSYVRATLDRLLLHLTPVAALLVGLGIKDLGQAPEESELNKPTAPRLPPPSASGWQDQRPLSIPPNSGG
jgi:hypothetical protein